MHSQCLASLPRWRGGCTPDSSRHPNEALRPDRPALQDSLSVWWNPPFRGKEAKVWLFSFSSLTKKMINIYNLYLPMFKYK